MGMLTKVGQCVNNSRHLFVTGHNTRYTTQLQTKSILALETGPFTWKGSEHAPTVHPWNGIMR